MDCGDFANRSWSVFFSSCVMGRVARARCSRPSSSSWIRLCLKACRRFVGSDSWACHRSAVAGAISPMSLLLSNRSSAPAFLGAYRSGKEGVQREEGANPVHWLGLTGDDGLLPA